MPAASLVELPALQSMLTDLVAPWVAELGLQVRSASAGEVVLAVMSQLGQFQPMTTVQLQTSFLRPIPGSRTEAAGEATVIGRVLRLGRNLVFGEIEVLDAGGKLAAHATTTYALL